MKKDKRKFEIWKFEHNKKQNVRWYLDRIFQELIWYKMEMSWIQMLKSKCMEDILTVQRRELKLFVIFSIFSIFFFHNLNFKQKDKNEKEKRREENEKNEKKRGIGRKKSYSIEVFYLNIYFLNVISWTVQCTERHVFHMLWTRVRDNTSNM